MEAEDRERERKKLAQRRLKDQRRMEREERRRKQKMRQKFSSDEDHKIAVEERKLLVAQRKLESIRLLDELIERVKVICASNLIFIGRVYKVYQKGVMTSKD